jgi:tRNA-Thr(GGU) m(6)t(6)A37 methyltransferase TsaA
MESYTLNPIAYIHSDFPEKFGIPRQSGLIDGLSASITFVPPYGDPAALRGLEDYSHIWLVWGFSMSFGKDWSPTVRPPKLGGNQRMGVFATRSPFRPNPLGLSCVRLISIDLASNASPVLYVDGADLMDGTPIFDIKPYLPYVDSRPEASEGFGGPLKNTNLNVDCPLKWLNLIPPKHRKPLIAILSQDPRPSYQHDSNRIYGMRYAELDVKFRVEKDTLHVCSINQM